MRAIESKSDRLDGPNVRARRDRMRTVETWRLQLVAMMSTEPKLSAPELEAATRLGDALIGFEGALATAGINEVTR